MVKSAYPEVDSKSVTATRMKIPFLDLSVKDPELKAELLETVDRVLSHGRLVLGAEVEQFEARVAEMAQKKYAVGVNSGTDAVYLALRSLDVGPGDEVITTALSWIATTNAIALCGATPVFIDIRGDLNIDPTLIEAAITPRTKVILPVHFTGTLCDMDPILEIARRYGLAVVEDAAQAFGAHFQGRMAGSFGKVNAFSMNPMKVFGAYGEAGAVVTDDEELRAKLVALRYNGTIEREDCHWPSVNGRIDTLQAAMLLVNLKYLEARIAHRRKLAAVYSSALDGVVDCPPQKPGYFDVFYNYTLRAPKRDELRAHLEEAGIETKIQHPILMPYHTAYRGKFQPHIPLAQHLVQQIVCIPCHEKMDVGQADYVATSIKEFYGAAV